jgi:major membrane immunogen (membrane-anchored lipoprotein)
MAMENKKAFKERKFDALNAAKAQGIVDVVTGSDGVSPETVKLAAGLMEKHGKAANERIINRLKSQET